MILKIRHLKIIAGFVLLFFLAGCSPQMRSYKGARIIMGTVWEITVYGINKNICLEAIETAFKEVERVDSVFSVYNQQSQASRINKEAGASKVKVSDEVFELTQRAMFFSEVSGGAFDITVLPLVKAWGFYDRKPRRPSQEEIDEILKRVGYDKVVLDAATKEISFTDKDVKLDFGAIAKGYGVQRAILALKVCGITSALVNGGGNIYCMGSLPSGEPWKVGIKDPLDKAKVAKTIVLKDQAVATSGGYENFFEINGKKYCHIIDPRTGFPVEGVLSATVIAMDAATADALSTTSFVLGREKSQPLRLLPGVIDIIIE